MLLSQHPAIVRQKPEATALHKLGVVRFQRIAGEIQRITRCNLWQALAILVVGDVVAAFFIDFQESVKEDHLTRRTQFDFPVGAGDCDCGPLKPRGLHLAGDGPLPDEIVKLPLVVFRQL